MSINKTVVATELYTTEASESAKRAAKEKEMPDKDDSKAKLEELLKKSAGAADETTK